MNALTFGEKFYPGYTMAVAVSNDLEKFNNTEDNACYKLVFLKSGNAKICINEKELIIFGPKIICLNEKDQHFLSLDNKDEILILYFCPTVLNSKFSYEACKTGQGLTFTERQDLFYFKKFLYDDINYKIISVNSFDAIKIGEKIALLDDLLTLQSDINWPCRSRATLLEVLFLIMGNVDNPIDDNIEVDTSYSEFTKDVICYLQSRYDQKITLNKIVSDLHTNRTTLLNDFKKSTGISYLKYLTQLRIKISASMLADTELSINEICDRSGFNDVSYFCKSFKKETKYTPTEFRQLNSTYPH